MSWSRVVSLLPALRVSIDMDEFRRFPLVAHVIYRLDVGGLENGLVNLINRIPEDRYRQAIICLDKSTNFARNISSPNVEIVELNKRPGKDVGCYFRFWKVLRRLRPDVVHTRNLGTIDLVYPALLAGVPYRIHGEHGWDMVDLHGENRKYRRLRRACVPFFQHVTTVSRHLRSWLIDEIGVAPDKVTSIVNGVDTKRFSPTSFSKHERSAEFVIGTVGRIVPVKDQMTLIRAFRRIVEDRDPNWPKLRLVIVGDGPLLEELRSVVESAGLDGLVELPGRDEMIPARLQAFDLFVLPSLNEGISNTILEAMATGLPCVATNVGGNPEIVSDGETGQLFPAGDIESLVSAIRRYLDSPELLHKHGARARQMAESMFSLDRMVEHYLTVYDAILEKRSVRVGSAV